MEKNQDFSDFSQCLKRVEKEMLKRCVFLKEHNFPKQLEHVDTKFRIVQEIRFEVDMIASGKIKPSEATFVNLESLK